MDQKGILPLLIAGAIMLILGLLMTFLMAIIGVSSAQDAIWCKIMKDQYNAEDMQVCSDTIIEALQSTGQIPQDQIKLTANQALSVHCTFDVLGGAYGRFDPWPPITDDCGLRGAVCKDRDAAGELIPAVCEVANPPAGVTRIGVVLGDQSCPESFVAIGPAAFKSPDGQNYWICKQMGEATVAAIEAPVSPNGSADSACSGAGFVPLSTNPPAATLFTGSDGASYQLCQKTGTGQILDIVSVEKTAADTSCGDLSLLTSLTGGDDKEYLVCFKQQAQQGSCNCATTPEQLAAVSCSTDQWATVSPECQAVCPQFGTACTEDPAKPICNAGTHACVSLSDYPCGQEVLGSPGVKGVGCAAGQVCNLESSVCVDVGDQTTGALSRPKYAFDVANTQDTADSVNACFGFGTEAETVSSAGKLVSIALGMPSEDNAKFRLSNEKLLSGLGKGGVLPFSISNESLSGSYNYALINVSDTVLKSDGTLGLKTEEFLVKLRARDATVCYSEDGLEGHTGPSMAPRLRYTWSFEDSTGIAIDSCDQKKIDGSPNTGFIYCDATQFSIELSKKLSQIISTAEEGQPVAADSLLLDFNAYLMPDGFSSDFRKDFNFVQENVAFFSQNDAYKKIASYFTNESRLVLPTRVPKLGKYRVVITQGFAQGKSNVFFEDNFPIANLVLTMTLLEENLSKNPLYFMPVDYKIGTVKRPGENAAGRNGYGIGLSAPMNANAEVGIDAVTSTGGSGSFGSENQTNWLSSLDAPNRGIVLELSSPTVDAPGLFSWSISKATPVMISIPLKSGKAQAFFELMQNESSVNTAGKPIGLWTGAGSTAGDPCADFSGQPLLSNASEPSPVAGTCAETSADARGFLLSGNKEGKQVFYKTVIYTPAGNFSLRKAAGCETAFEILSPTDLTNASQSTVGLGYFDLQLSSLQMYSGTGTAVFYWNRDVVLDALGHPQNFVPRPLFDQTNLSGFSTVTACTQAT
ncbi:MAG: hypothetical protein J4215_05645 [Candidatus Diapherotrites archaeon]|uniref:Uncharacterized protein n=1 Tax=Candidatus Iainarchaeum sp. TaxID=3101447 RepID=A0A8T4L3Y9_9ARCH|nr:hypothetical protein [Candidatus Diapherotrites archaeon]